MCSYLTSFFLPEDRRLWVPFRLTWETCSPSLRHNLIPRPDHELWCSWVKNQRHEHYTIPSDTQMHTTHTHTRWSLSVSGKRQASNRHWLPRSLRQSFHASARFRQHSASWFICLLWPQTERTATATTGSHSSRWARRWPYWMNDGQLSGTAVLRSQHQREGWVIPVRTHGEEKLCEDATPWTCVDTSFVSGFKCSTLFTLRTQNSFYSCIEDKQSSQAGRAWKTSNWLLAF